MEFFFFQAEDGIRDATVTGVQTCALPISAIPWPASWSATPTTTSARMPGQIGRASCRERVYIAVQAGAPERKNRKGGRALASLVGSDAANRGPPAVAPDWPASAPGAGREE